MADIQWPMVSKQRLTANTSISARPYALGWTALARKATLAQGNTFCYGGRVMAAATSIKLDDALKGRVQHLAEVRRRSSHWIMREAIAQYVEREEKREAFRQDALRAWDEYQQTGLHLTLEEADAWLAKLEAGEDAEPPKCHV
ncbi:MAG: CopG family ribbon-helix-helix protein [Sphingomonas sp.]|jgi:predicted transcriptional regulator|nr:MULTISPECIES: CopG family ribbon-helix-helix protein [Sphingomonas]MDK2770313.1 CopG family ribbon-helix-helix protein [Sphingomonas sp.]